MSFAMGCYCARLFLEYAKSHALSAGILFCDLSAAYYAVVRELLLGQNLTDAPLEEVTRSLGLENEDLQLLRAYVEQEAIINDEGDEHILQALAREVHSNTWFWLHDDRKLVMTRRGTRPGSSWADILFGILFSKVLRRRGDFANLELCPAIAWSGKRELVPFDARRKDKQEVKVQDIVYADDLATCVVTAEAEKLPGAVRHVAGVQLDTLVAHGLRANIGAKKTAALLVPAGAGAKRVRKQLFTVGKGKLHVMRENVGAVALDAVSSYRHLGTILTHNGSLAQEIRVKMAVVRAAFKEGRGTIFCAPCIALERRALLFRVYVLSALFSGSGAWPTVCQAGWRVLDSGVTSLARQMLRISPSGAQNWSKERIFGTLGVLDAAGLLALERLRFLGQLCRAGPDAAFALLQHSTSALAAMRAAMDWFVQAVGATSGLGSGSDWGLWQELLCQKGRFGGMLKRAAAWHIGRFQACAHFQTFCRRTWPQAPPPAVEPEIAQHMCLLCNIAFFDFHSWSAHAARKHQYRARCIRFTEGRRCRACGTCFPTVLRHRRHLQTHSLCCRAVEWNVPELLPPLLGADEHVQGETIPGTGTGHLPALPEGICVGLFLALREARFSSDVEIFDLVKSFVEPFPMLRATLAAWTEELQPSQVKDWASDVLLCMQVDLWCESTSRIPRSASLRTADFQPLIQPLLVIDSVSESPPPRVIVLDQAAAPVGLDSPGSSTLLDFWGPLPVACPGSGIDLCIPPPPVPASDLWRFDSCPLRGMREHCRWLVQVLAWIGLTVELATFGRACSIRADFSRDRMGVLADWLLEASQSPLGRSSLSLRFTS